ncbi:hypothetical protein FACS1894184_17090 [Clostridia bacterium]|nr:hypothetical protein FACS1894184_17090 [Clostridia bacterium]
MPTLSMFYGIVITMYSERTGQHHVPHFRAEYQGEEAAISMDGDVLEGSLPKSKMKLVLAWADIHRDDLIANWGLLAAGREFFRIDPLR